MNFKLLILFLLIFLCIANVSAEDNITVNTQDFIKYYQNDTNFQCILESQSANVSGREVTFNINNVSYTKFTNDDGIATMGIYLNPGNYIISTTFQNSTVYNNITVLSVIESSDLVMYYCNGSSFVVKLFDKQGCAVCNASVCFNINGVFYNRVSNSSGFAKLDIYLNPNTYVITAYYDNLARSNNITVLSVIGSSDLVMYYCNGSSFVVKLFDKQGDVVCNASVCFNINGVFYNRVSNSSGFAKLDIYLRPNTYVITAYYDNLARSNNITVLSTVISSGDIKTTYGNKCKLDITVFNKSGALIKNKEVTFNIGGTFYKNITNNNGVASLNLNLNSGKYIITYEVDGFIGSNNYEVRNSIDIKTYNWNSGAVITQNNVIKNNLPSNELVNEIVEAAKSGTPMVTIKGGSGKSVFITAGVHGNELSSQIAALRLINYLENTDIDGTVYIMPFVCPKGTADNVRNYNGVNLNVLATTSGTISNNIINLILSFGCDAYADFHCTRPGGDPGDNVVMGSYSPLIESANMASKISEMTGFSNVIYNVAGIPYQGALEDTSNIKGIPAITCEVLTPPGTIATGSVEISLNFMKSFLKYNSII